MSNDLLAAANRNTPDDPTQEVRAFILSEALRRVVMSIEPVRVLDLDRNLRLACAERFGTSLEEERAPFIWPAIFALVRSGVLLSTGWDAADKSHTIGADTMLRPDNSLTVYMWAENMGVFRERGDDEVDLA